VRIDVEDPARRIPIPTMMIQTLVENAVKHGVCAVRSNGLVEIDARLEGGRLRIAVADNGPGLAGLPEPDARGNGYGLRNVRQRLRGYFGEDAFLAAQRDEPRGMTVVSIVMPAGRP
jgi:LytS/YehU family sensor histidine kinase